MIESATLAQVAAGEAPAPEQMPPARYTLDGSLEQPDDEPWPNFQVDGYGMWLWALARHSNGRPVQRWSKTVELVARYISATWQLKSFSCWEEFDDGEHASTLGALVAGLDCSGTAAAGPSAGPARPTACARRCSTVRHRRPLHARPRRRAARRQPAVARRSVRRRAARRPDLSHATVAGVSHELLRPDGGVYRYLGDTYYGGGEWLLLTCRSPGTTHGPAPGRRRAPREWVRQTRVPNGDLPEQVTDHAQEPGMIAPWVAALGAVATPLLWSHAMYLITEDARSHDRAAARRRRPSRPDDRSRSSSAENTITVARCGTSTGSSPRSSSPTGARRRFAAAAAKAATASRATARRTALDVLADPLESSALRLRLRLRAGRRRRRRRRQRAPAAPQRRPVLRLDVPARRLCAAGRTSSSTRWAGAVTRHRPASRRRVSAAGSLPLGYAAVYAAGPDEWPDWRQTASTARTANRGCWATSSGTSIRRTRAG